MTGPVQLLYTLLTAAARDRDPMAPPPAEAFHGLCIPSKLPLIEQELVLGPTRSRPSSSSTRWRSPCSSGSAAAAASSFAPSTASLTAAFRRFSASSCAEASWAAPASSENCRCPRNAATWVCSSSVLLAALLSCCSSSLILQGPESDVSEMDQSSC